MQQDSVHPESPRHIQCIVCGGGAVRARLLKASDSDIYTCASCRLQFCWPMPTDEQFREYYSSYTDHRAAEEVVVRNARRNIRALEQFGLSRLSRLLDFGSGAGAFVRAGGSETWYNWDPYANDSDTARLGDAYDWITLWGVLEHVPEPRVCMQHLVEKLVTGGCMALTTVWADAAIPFQYKPPEHVTYWSTESLYVLADRVGLEVVLLKPYMMEQYADVYLSAVLRTVPLHLRSLISHQLDEIVEVPTNEVFVVLQKTGD